MPIIHFVNPQNQTTSITVDAGTNVKDAALDNGIEGIYGECGGSCTCATCHVYVDAQWFNRIEAADDFEQDMLEFAADATLESRLSCQIKVSDAQDGIIIKIPARQY
ncbi:MAG: 2Fe-2S iron-sulfur cluster binding domain-containing protein [OCS116 cluster bacterium]|nr:2Fe-2S iron-sulfur cluster binding domain-containing protein [OCS116 cluster bacterium]